MSILDVLEKKKWYKIVFLIVIPILGVAGIVFSIYTYLNPQHKELSYEIGPVVPVTDLSVVADTRIKVYFDDKQVKNISLVTINFANTGSLAIDNSDFKKPVVISLPKPSTILAANTFGASDHRLDKELINNLRVDSSGNVTLSSVFLNPGNGFTISLILSDYDKQMFDFDYLIKDIIKLKKIDKEKTKNFQTVIIMILSLLAGALFSILWESVKGILKYLNSSRKKRSLEEKAVTAK